MTRVVTVTLNPALDVTYDVTALATSGSVRVGAVRSRAGGKGVNVAAVVRQLGADSLAIAPTALTCPDPFRAALDRIGLAHRLIPSFDEVRRTVTVVAADGTTTVLLEPGGTVGPDTAQAVVDAVADELGHADVLVVSGSLPPGLPDDLPARLAALASGIPVIVDVSGPALRAAAGAGAVLTPNADEFAELVGQPSRSRADLVTHGRRLLTGGAAAVIVTLGSAGAVAVTPDGAFSARTAEIIAGNPTGAGDAAAAALALHLASGTVSWPDALADAIATSAACVMRPVAGEIDLQARARWRATINVEELW